MTAAECSAYCYFCLSWVRVWAFHFNVLHLILGFCLACRHVTFNRLIVLFIEFLYVKWADGK